MANHDVISYGKLYLGVPYRWWNPDISCYGDSGPFWAFEGGAPTQSRVKTEHLNCAGFLNVICRHMGIKIPGVDEKSYYAGGTYEWYVYLDRNKKLKPYVEGAEYPVGSLLLRNYRNIEDQGHIALVYGSGKHIHSWPEGGVCITPIMKNYYEHVVLPTDWVQ